MSLARESNEITKLNWFNGIGSCSARDPFTWFALRTFSLISILFLCSPGKGNCERARGREGGREVVHRCLIDKQVETLAQTEARSFNDDLIWKLPGIIELTYARIELKHFNVCLSSELGEGNGNLTLWLCVCVCESVSVCMWWHLITKAY